MPGKLVATRNCGSDVGSAEFLQVPHGQTEDLQGGLAVADRVMSTARDLT
jgi:hypothetical protein